jgi:uncharacterized protein with PIN domain
MDQPKFIADAMLGSLARKLRLLGIDTLFIKDATDNELKYTVLSQDRILLTKDKALAGGLGSRAWLVTGGNVREEFESIAGRLNEISSEIQPYSRCLDCNHLLRSILPHEAEGKVPPYILSSNTHFSQCITCGKVFWEGTHRERMEGEIEWMREILMDA